uniref:phosphatidate cytidylyltransferase n=1 Tax=Sinocyclocheilus grahami TaxID=75366 RepID=A0A672RVF8_SINGR
MNCLSSWRFILKSLLSELQDQHSEDEETYETSDIENKSDSEGLNKVLSGLSWRWRGILTLAMISGFFCSVYLDPMALMTIVLCFQIKCFHEMITISYHWHHLPWFRTLSWYFLLYVNYFLFGETLTDNFFTLVQREEPLHLLSQSHGFIPFAVYLAGFCLFALSLVKRRRCLQFYMFSWTLMILCPSLTLFIMAYMFDFFFGRTPLFKLSPKKAEEGFTSDFFSTVVFGIILSYLMLLPDQQLQIFNSIKAHLIERGSLLFEYDSLHLSTTRYKMNHSPLSLASNKILSVSENLFHAPTV